MTTLAFISGLLFIAMLIFIDHYKPPPPDDRINSYEVNIP